jgi:hypothetical protein
MTPFLAGSTRKSAREFANERLFKPIGMIWAEKKYVTFARLNPLKKCMQLM